MLIDSHCHLNFIDLTEFDNRLENVLQQAKESGVHHMLCVCVEPKDYPVLCDIAEQYPDISISIGLHPNNQVEQEPDVDYLFEKSQHPKCIAIGETGLDYYRSESDQEHRLQKNRFSAHIQAAIRSQKPLIIHTRQAAQDTLALMKSEHADEVGGVMHCFAEDWSVARQALDLNFYISFSGIVTFKNAKALQDVAQRVPLDRMLIETDSPYLAPVPFRGKQNHPALVNYVAKQIASLRGMSYEEVARLTSENFYNCFKIKN